MRVLTLDFWDTLYRHCRTAEYRAMTRETILLQYCKARALEEPEEIASTAFNVIDRFIKDSWKKGVCPLPQSVVEHTRANYRDRYSTETILGLIQEVNRIYTTILKPELFDGAAHFLHWASSRMSLYLISDTYTVRGETLDTILEADGLKELFRDRFYSDAVGFEKPNITSMEHIIASEAVAPRDIIHVGDLMDRDYELAKRFGCKFVLLQHSSSAPPVSGLLDYDVFVGKCSSFDELKNFLEDI
jgi:FMN phosphatase YigB (HAD superfamily)